MMQTAKPALLNLRQLEFIAIGGTIGAGLFLGAGTGIRAAGPSMLLAYALAGAMVFVVARCLGEMALSDAKPSVFVIYTERHLGPRAAFIQAWSYWVCFILVAMAELTAAGIFLRLWFPALPSWSAAIAGLTLLFGINRLSVRVFGEVEFWMSLLKIATVLVFLLVTTAIVLGIGFSAQPGVSIRNLWTNGGFFPRGLSGFLGVMPLALFAFGGTELVGIAAAEAEDPARSVPRAINGLLIRLGLFYIGTTLAVLLLVPWSSVAVDSSPMVALFDRIGVPNVATLMNIVLISAVLSSCNTMLFAASRMLKVLAEMHGAPRGLAQVNAHGAPQRAAILTFAVICLAIALNYLLPALLFQVLLGMAAMVLVGNWAIFLIVHIRFRKARPSTTGSRFPVPGAPWSNYVVLLLLGAMVPVAAFDRGLRLPVIMALVLFALLAGIATLWTKLTGVLTASVPQ